MMIAMFRMNRASAAYLVILMIALTGMGTGFAEDGISLDAKFPRLEDVARQMEMRGLNGDGNSIQSELIATLLKSTDPNAGIFTAEEMEEFNRKLDGYRDCAGIVLGKGERFPTVSKICHPEPIPIEKGDVLLSVDGRATDKRDILKVYADLEGKPNQDISVVYSNTQKAVVATSLVERVAVQMPPLALRETLPRGIGYIKIRGFYGELGELEEAVGEGVQSGGSLGLILDVRGAVGRSKEGVGRIVQSLGVAEGTLFRYERLEHSDEFKTEFPLESNSDPQGTDGRQPIIILVDSDTRAAAELFAAVCKSAIDGAIVLGEKTYGDPLIREFTPLPAGRKLYLLASRLTVKGGAVYGKEQHSVVPDIQLSSESVSSWSAGGDYNPYYERKTAAGEEINQELAERLGDDNLLHRAVDILLGLEALGFN